jgi:hypothetical protein
MIRCFDEYTTETSDVLKIIALDTSKPACVILLRAFHTAVLVHLAKAPYHSERLTSKKEIEKNTEARIAVVYLATQLFQQDPQSFFYSIQVLGSFGTS